MPVDGLVGLRVTAVLLFSKSCKFQCVLPLCPASRLFVGADVGSKQTSSKAKSGTYAKIDKRVLTAEQQRAFCRIGAIIRGFLTRRLLKTEKVKHLRQTIVDTQEFIRSFKTEGSQKKGTYSAQDRSLQERVRAQLRAAIYDIHDIFFEMPLGDRLALLQQDRELRAERKLRDMEKAKCPKERVVLSAATQRSLDRKKRSWYRRTPEERVKRTDSLKKQHSLG
ncbi:Centriolar coiled-coil protein of 110 kDa [Collichthys lucidus]|uniref:Centriolar coiled-coil protein of 110 kDa n=1 Tax=Collichthys lucidus TaxID=240159 RepID=A0A4U5VU97_COLLU|nr:Centriolar coiled-coil protein of 110 kDa [Collichthys lucidus]